MNGTLWTILIAAALAALGVLAVRSLIRERKKGGCSCGSGSGCCGDCARCRHSCDNKEE